MQRLKRTGITIIALIGLLSGSAVAFAADEEVAEAETDADESADTLFNFGYDLVNRVFVWGLSRLDGIYDCTLENGTLTATYGTTDDEGVIPVDNLEDEAGAVMFPNRPADEVADDQVPAEAPIAYLGADGECGVSGGNVSGPNGQVNHGMFMKLFNSIYDGPRRGCVVRHLAQSGLGQGDQQVEAGDDAVEPVTMGDSGTVDFTSIETDCERGKTTDDQAVETESDAQAGNGRPEGAGKPDHAGKPGATGSDRPGNSGSAPGHNK
jgi:hypothetical protein